MGCVKAKVIEIIEMGEGDKSKKSRIMTKTLKIVFLCTIISVLFFAPLVQEKF